MTTADQAAAAQLRSDRAKTAAKTRLRKKREAKEKDCDKPCACGGEGLPLDVITRASHLSIPSLKGCPHCCTFSFLELFQIVQKKTDPKKSGVHVRNTEQHGEVFVHYCKDSSTGTKKPRSVVMNRKTGKPVTVDEVLKMFEPKKKKLG